MLKGDSYANRPDLRFRLRLPIGPDLRPGGNESNNLLKQSSIVNYWRPIHFHLIRGAHVATEIGRRQIRTGFNHSR
jgi:hypothetical protein